MCHIHLYMATNRNVYNLYLHVMGFNFLERVICNRHDVATSQSDAYENSNNDDDDKHDGYLHWLRNESSAIRTIRQSLSYHMSNIKRHFRNNWNVFCV